MISLQESIPLAQRALTHARSRDRAMVEDALSRSSVVRAFCEPEVGTTSLLAYCLRGETPLRLDLDAVSGPGDLAWLMARGLAIQTIGAERLGLLHGPAKLRSPASRKALVELQTRLDVELAELALSASPPDKDSEAVLAIAMDALENVLRHGAQVSVWVDHLEAPGTTPRHPVSPRDLLWQLRSIRQRQPAMRLIVSGRTPAQKLAEDNEGALYGDGRAIVLDRPEEPVWQKVCHDLARLGARGISEGIVRDLYDAAEGHPVIMLLAICERASSRERQTSARSQVTTMVSRDDGLTARAIQHARTLHRLGAQVLTEVAFGRKPYRQPGLGSTPQEINRALQRLHQAGLVTSHGHGSWTVTNPLVSLRLRGGLMALPPQGTDVPDAFDAETIRERGLFSRYGCKQENCHPTWQRMDSGKAWSQPSQFRA